MATATQLDRQDSGVTVLRGVSFREYTRLTRHPANRHLRMAYFDGTLEIMSPGIRQHGIPSRRFGLIIAAVAIALRLDYEATGAGTFRRRGDGPRKGTGREPDASFYFASFDRLPQDRDPDLDAGDPPPDLWVEVDYRASSTARLPTYARLGVPEVWQYRSPSRSLRFLRRAGDRYEPIDRSLSLPVLTPELVLEALAAGETLGEGRWLPWLLQWSQQFRPRVA